MKIFIDNKLFLAETKDKGFGIFTKEDILENTIVEISPVIKLKINDLKKEFKKIKIWCYDWNQKSVGLSSGFGPLYNHDWNPNVKMDYLKNQYFSFKTTKKIKKNEELTINYGSTWWKKTNHPENKIEYQESKLLNYLFVNKSVELIKNRFGNHILKAKENISKGTILEISRCLFFKYKKLNKSNCLNKYFYHLKNNNFTFGFGYANLYKTNSKNNNVKWYIKNKRLHFEAKENIEKGDILKIASKYYKNL